MNTVSYMFWGVRLGIFGGDEIQKWVDGQLVKTDTPNDDLIELSFIEKSDLKSMYAILYRMTGNTLDYEELTKLLLTMPNDKLSCAPFCMELSKRLYQIWIESGYALSDYLEKLASYDDAFSLASEGLNGSVEGVHADFIEDISSYGRYL